MEKKIEDLEKKIESLEEKLDLISEILLTKIQPNTSKMSNHIDFIETVYDNIKNPLGYFIHKLSYFKGNNVNHSIEDNKFN